jgi:fucose 4-O-acetylase-like acetyltransferase
MTQIENGKRVAYWDNAKALLIFLVVLGHFLQPVRDRGQSVLVFYNWIYFFHMPAFVFVSGYFAKSYIRREASRSGKLVGFLILYTGFYLADWGLQCLLKQQFSVLKLFSLTRAPWYMLCMFLWYLVLPFLAEIGPRISLPASVLLALLVGTDPNCGSFLSLSRFSCFSPSF